MSEPRNERPAGRGLEQIVREVLDMQGPQLRSQGISVSTDLPADVVNFEPRAIRLAVFQLVAHAVESMPDGGDLHVAAYIDAETLELEVADSGQAVEDRRLLLSDPLAPVRKLAARMGGSIRLINCAQGGAARVLRLPRGKSSRAAA